MSATIIYPDTLNRFADSPKITLDKINQGGGLGGASGAAVIAAAIAENRQVYIDRAPSDPDNVNIPAVNYPSGGGPMQQWDINTLQWL